MFNHLDNLNCVLANDFVFKCAKKIELFIVRCGCYYMNDVSVTSLCEFKSSVAVSEGRFSKSFVSLFTVLPNANEICSSYVTVSK